MKKLATVVPMIYEGYLLIALHPNWIKLFQKIPTFLVKIDDHGRLHIISEERIKKWRK